MSALSRNHMVTHVKDEMCKTNTPNHMDKLRDVQHIASSGRVGPFVFIAQDQQTGLFYTEVETGDGNAGTNLFAMIGVLETLKLELLECAALAPTIDHSGRPINPHQEESEVS